MFKLDTLNKAEQGVFFQHVINDCEIGLIVLDADASIVDWNDWVSQRTHLELVAVQGQRLCEIFPAINNSHLDKAIQQALQHKVSTVLPFALNSTPLPLVNSDGCPLPQHSIVKPLHNLAGGNFCLLQISDVSATVGREQQLLDQAQKSKAIAEKLAHKKHRVQVALDTITDGVITTDSEGLILSMNPVAELLTGVSEAQAENQAIDSIFRLLDAHTSAGIPCAVRACLQLGASVNDEQDYLLQSQNGQHHAVTTSVAPIKSEAQEILGAVLVFRDISHTKALSAKLNWHAHHDALTGLPNRLAFETQMKGLLEGLKNTPQQYQHHLLYLDLDQFKVINDTCGHDAGDELIRQLVLVLQQHLRKTDLLARIGGDEFGVLLVACDAEMACEIANNLRQATLDFRFAWESQSFRIAMSIGIATMTGDEARAAEILSAADAACFVAKEQGRNRVHFHALDDAFGSASQQKEMQWISKIQAALDEDRFVLYAQLIQNIQDTELDVLHYEILLRMLGENNQIIPPGAFLPAAERFNMIASVDRWVIDHLIEAVMAKASEIKDLSKLVFSINLSGASMSDDLLLAHILELLDNIPILPSNLCFEITETAVISNLDNATKFLTVLRSKGCKVALDDFGSGLSSFAYLQQLPIDFLKIDGQFVKDMEFNSINEAVVDTINSLGHVMGLETIAEFVENDGIANVLFKLGVNYAQGYGVHKPCPLVDIL